jgi:RNA polymerase-binding transcription factor DksA
MTKMTNAAGLDARKQDALKKKLLEARAELASRRSEQLRARTGLVAEVEDEADAAARAGHEDALVSLSEAGHARLREIDHALAKFDTGEYGLDEETGEPIEYGRLSVIPWARFAAGTQEEHERPD